jgi:hypothetical protein
MPEVPPPPMSDTERMLRPQGLFQQGQFGQQGQFAQQGQFGQQGPYGPQGRGPQVWPGPGGPPPPGVNYPLEDGMFTPPGGVPRAPQSWRRGSRLRRPGGPLAAGVVAGVLVVIVVIAVFVSMHGNGTASSGGGATASGTPTGTAKASTTAAQEKQAAAQLATLLAQSGSDRGDVVNAVVNVESCGKNLSQDAQTFTKAAANRRVLLSKLAALPGRSALPAAMLTDLTSGWQASAQADSDLVKWADDQISQGCHKNKVQNDPNWKASLTPDSQATNGKQAFTALWNPLAKKDGLPTYTFDQI